MKKNCFFNNLRMMIIFAVLIFHNLFIDQVEASCRFFRFDKIDRDSNELKSHGLASVDVLTPLPAPSLVQPVLSGTGTVGALVVTSRLLAESPFVVSAAELPSPSSSPNVLAIVICSLLLAGVLIGLFWSICAKWDVDCGEVVVQSPRVSAALPLTSYKPGSSVDGSGSRGAGVSVSTDPPLEIGHGGGVSKPATHPPDLLAANARSIGESKPSHPPVVAKARGNGGEAKPSHPPVVAKARGDGGEAKPSCPPTPQVNGARPTNQTRPPMAFEFRGGGAVPTHPPSTSIANVGLRGGGFEATHAEPSIGNGVGGGGSKPSNAVVPPVVNGNGGDRSVGDQPSAPPIARRKSRTSMRSSMEPRVKTDVRNAPIELVTRHPIRVTEPGESSAGPSRLTEVGLIAFSYEELRDSTDDFSRANFLGEGGFAKVYKGSLSNGRKVAVKVLRNETSKAEKEFRNEVDIISRARHRNIVSLVGYCITQTKRLIVYEFVENSSLHDHLKGRKNLQVMDWAVRIKIAKGASKGLAYLHEECPQKIIHRDVKPANILLDFSFVPKVADFGISKLCPDHFDSLIATYAIGSVGFIDPVYMETKELSAKSDVYAFGVVLLMLISGQVDLVKVHGLKSELSRALKSSNFHGIADERLNDKYNVDEMTRMVTCADACIRRNPKDRPDMSQISRVLENIVSPMELRIKTRPR